MKRKLLSLLLAFTMVLSLLPATVLSASAAEEVSSADDLQAKISEATGTVEIKLTADISCTGLTIPAPKEENEEDEASPPSTNPLTSLTIDLAGHTLSLGSGSITVTGAELAVKSSEAGGTITSSGTAISVTGANSKLSMTSGTIEATTPISSSTDAVVSITGGVFSKSVAGSYIAEGSKGFQLKNNYIVATVASETPEADLEAVVVHANGSAPVAGKLQAVISAATNGDTVWLVKSVTPQSDIIINNNITLELDGNAIIFESYWDTTLRSMTIGKLSIDAGVTINGGNGGKIEQGYGYNISEDDIANIFAVQIGAGASPVTINSTTIVSNANIGIETKGKKLIIKGGSKVTGQEKGIEASGTELTVSGAGTEITGEIKNSNSIGVSLTSGSTMIIEGGTITGGKNGIEVTGGSNTLTVDGANTKITGTSGTGVSFIDDGGTLSVRGGTITGGENGIQFGGSMMTVEGDSTTIRSDYGLTEWNKDTYTVKGAGIAVFSVQELLWIKSGNIEGPTALYFVEKQPGFSSYNDLLITGGTLQSPLDDGKSVDVVESVPPGFIQGGTFLNKGGKDPLPEEYLGPGWIQKESGAVVHPEEGVAVVTFDAGDGGTFGNKGRWMKVRVIEGDTLSESDWPADPTREGYTFIKNWYIEEHGVEDAKPFDFDEPITEDVTVHAHWRPMVTVIFNPTEGSFGTDEEGEEIEYKEQIEMGGTLSKLPDDPTPEKDSGRTFGGWYTGDAHPTEKEEKVTLETVFPIGFGEDEEDKDYTDADRKITVHAHWGYEITFNANGGTLKAGDERRVTGQVNDDNKGTLELSEFPTPTPTGYNKFVGWFIHPENEGDGRVDQEEDPYPFKEATKLYAHWVPRVDINLSPESEYLPAKDLSVTDPVTSEIVLIAKGEDAEFISNIAEKAKELFTLTFDDGSEEGPKPVDHFSVALDGSNLLKVIITLEGDDVPTTAGTLNIKVKDDVFEKPPKVREFSFDIPVVYVVKYDFNGGDGTPEESRTKADGTAVTWPNNPTHPDDHAFLGWYTQAKEGNEVDPRTEKYESSKTLYAHWGYKISFDPNGGSLKTGDGTKNTEEIGKKDEEGDGILKEWPADPTRPGYTFIGWYTEDGNDGNDGTKIEKTDDGTYSFSGPTTLFAHWKRTVTITFNANGGVFAAPETGIMVVDIDEDGVLLYDKDDPVAPPGAVKTPADPTRYGYDFDGWYESKDSKDKIEFPLKITETDEKTGKQVDEITLYAHWIENNPGKYTITFNANGGLIPSPVPEGIVVSGDAKTATGETDEKTGKLAEAPTAFRDNYEFLGWYDAAVDGNKVDFSKAFRDNTTVYAYWGLNITFDPVGGEFGASEKPDDKGYVVKTTDENFKLTALPSDPTLEGYNFKGWYADKDSKDIPITTEYVFGPGTNTVYAHWEPKVMYTITFDLGYAADNRTFAEIKVEADENGEGRLSGLPTPNPTRDGWNFKEWNTKQDGTGDKVTVTTVFTASTTVYAKWTEKKEYTITFDANGGELTGDGTATTGIDGKLAKLPSDPTRDGYTFEGWNTEKDGTGDKVTTEYVFIEPTTVYAQWTKIKEDDPSKPGPDDPSKPDEPTTKEYTITFNPNGGKLDDSDATAITSTDGTLSSLPTPSRVGYIFEGWYTSRNSGVRITTSYKFTANTTVYARYSSIPYMDIPSQPQQSQSQAPAQGSLPASAFTPVTWRPAAVMQDVPASSWAYSAAQWAYQNGYLDTAADGTFRLDESVSHLQMWRIMAQWLGQPSLDEGSVNQWARQSGAAKVGSASGTMTRQNMVEYLYQCYFLMGGNVSATGNLVQYRDGQQVTSTSAKNAWSWAVDKGIISGTTDGYLNPNKTLTRAEFATILMKMCQIR